MDHGEETRKPGGSAADGREGDPVEGQKIDPDMGTPEEGADPVEPKSRAE